MAIFLFLFSVALCTIVTLLTEPPDYTRIRGLAFGTLTADDKAQVRSSVTPLDIFFSIVLIGLIIGVLTFFTG